MSTRARWSTPGPRSVRGAQIGKNVHLSGGVGIGGVLEPCRPTRPSSRTTCFIGARSEVVEGVIVEENAVLGMGVFIGQSTKIFNRETGEVTYGQCPRARSSWPGRCRRGECKPLLCRHRQAGGREDAGQDEHQRTAADLTAGPAAAKRAPVARYALFSSDRTDSHTAPCGRIAVFLCGTRLPCRLLHVPGTPVRPDGRKGGVGPVPVGRLTDHDQDQRASACRFNQELAWLRSRSSRCWPNA